jgi:hypothetical protein
MSATVQNSAFFCMSDPGFIGETEVCFQIREFSVGGSHGRFIVEEDFV